MARKYRTHTVFHKDVNYDVVHIEENDIIYYNDMPYVLSSYGDDLQDAIKEKATILEIGCARFVPLQYNKPPF